MGTRSLTIVKENEKEICVLYRQMDGYVSGHGEELVEFLQPFKIVNGYSLEDKIGKVANGAGCLAAQLIAHFKTSIGQFYLYPAGTRDCGEEYIYTITCPVTGKPTLKIEAGYGTNFRTLFDGPLSKFDLKAVEKIEHEE